MYIKTLKSDLHEHREVSADMVRCTQYTKVTCKMEETSSHKTMSTDKETENQEFMRTVGGFCYFLTFFFHITTYNIDFVTFLLFFHITTYNIL